MSRAVRLSRLAPRDLPRVAHLEVAPDQLKFSGSVQEAFDAAEKGVDFHGIFLGDDAVGFFKIDRAFDQKYPFVAPQELGLRAFLIDRARQGQGIGPKAITALPAHVRALYPRAPALVLTVNKVNRPAVRAYLKGGFLDTGKEWPHGDAGPQHIMRMPL